MVNKVILVGRLGSDPEIRYTTSGSAIANMTVATTRYYKSKDEWVNQTEWHKVVVFGKLAESCTDRYKKGSLVYLEGRLQTRSWEDRDGNKRHVTEVVAEVVRALESTKKSWKTTSEYEEDDVPF